MRLVKAGYRAAMEKVTNAFSKIKDEYENEEVADRSNLWLEQQVKKEQR